MGKTMDSMDIDRLADYAVFCPEIFAWAAVSAGNARLIKYALERYGKHRTHIPEGTEEALRRGIFSSAAELYSYSPMTAVQMKGLTDAAVKKKGVDELTRMYVATRCAADDIWDASFGRENIENVLRSTGLSWLRRLILKYRVRKLSDDSVDSLLSDFRSEMVRMLADMYMDKDSVCIINVPDAYREAKTVHGCTDEIAGLAACIAEFPEETYGYHVAVKLEPRLARLTMMEGKTFPAPVVEKGRRMVEEVKAILMLCSGRMGYPPRLTPAGIAESLTKIYPDEDGGLTADIDNVTTTLRSLGFTVSFQKEQ